MSRTRARNRIGTTTLRLLVGALLVAGMLGTTFAASSAQGLPGMPGGPTGGSFIQVPSPREACLAVFPNGIIVGDPVVGTIDCSLIFGGGPPTEEPTEEPTDEPTEEPTDEPTDEPTNKPDHDGHDHDHDGHDTDHDHDGHDTDHDHDGHDTDHDHDGYDKGHDDKKDHDGYDKKDEDKADVGGKAYPTVTTMPSTGHAEESGGNTATATILAAMAMALATLSGIALRLTGARSSRG